MHAVKNFGLLVRVLAVGFCGIATLAIPASADAHIARSAASGAGHAYSYHVRYAMNNTPSIGVYPSSRPLQTQLFLSSGSWHYLEQWRLWRKGTGKYAGTCWMHAYLYGNYRDVHISKFHNGSPCPYPSRYNKATYFPLTGVFRWGWW